MKRILKKFSFAAGCIALFALAQVATYTTFAQWSTAPVPGTISFASDSLVARYNTSSSSYQYFGPVFPVSLVPQSGWSWVNQGTATITTSGGMLYMQTTAASGENLHLYSRTMPSTPFTVNAIVIPQLSEDIAHFDACGIGLYESGTGKFAGLSISPATGSPWSMQLQLNTWTNLTTFNSGIGLLNFLQQSPITLRILNDGTTLTASYMADRENPIEIGSVALTSAFTTAPNEIAFFKDPNSSGGGTGKLSGCTIFSWGN